MASISKAVRSRAGLELVDNGNAQGGALSHSANGGVASALRWFGGGAEDNGGAGVMLDNGARDLGVDGAGLRTMPAQASAPSRASPR